MKIQLLLVASVFLLMSCGNQPSNVEETDTQSIETNVPESQDEVSIIDPSLIMKVEGEYYRFEKENEKIYFQEPCKYIAYDIKITETAEGSGEWEIYYEDERYEIDQLEDKNGDIHLTTKAETKGMAITFLFAQNESEFLWDFAEMGMQDISPIVQVQNLDNFEIKPCTDATAIMSDLPSRWYLVSNIDGKDVLFEPCEEAPGGFSIEDNTYDNWSGHDPYEIVSMTKQNNRIIMEYKSVDNDELESLIIHNLYGEVIQLGEGLPDDEFYVNEKSKGIYKTVEEDCG